jgi:hypothetical protein
MRTKYFEHKQIFESVELDTESIDGQRYYTIPSGEKYRSVTTVLSSLNAKHIQEWRNRVGTETAQKITTQASRRGTKLHSVVENYIKNKNNFIEKETPASIDLFKSIKPILDQRIGAVYGQEFCLYSHFLKTAGRCDLFCDFDGTKTVVDIKSASKQKKVEWIENYFIQATTYAIMIAERYEIIVPKIAIVIGVENDDPQVFVENVKDWVWTTKAVFS